MMINKFIVFFCQNYWYYYDWEYGKMYLWCVYHWAICELLQQQPLFFKLILKL